MRGLLVSRIEAGARHQRSSPPSQVVAATNARRAIQRNIERDMIRARKREVLWDREVAEEYRVTCEGSVSDAPAAASKILLRNDLVELIGADAALVIRVAIDGFTQAEAAAELGIPMEAARKRYQRAMKRLRYAFEKID